MMRHALLALVVALAPPARAGAQQRPSQPDSQEPRPVSAEEIARLRREIESETRSSLDLFFDGHTETGGLNDKLSFGRVGARLNLKRGAATTLLLTASHTPYRTEDGVIEESGTRLTLGAHSRRSDRLDYEWELGATRFSTERWAGTGLVRVTIRSSEKLRYFLAASRSIVEESMLSAVGLEPVLGPFSGERVGAVTDNRLAGGGTWQLPLRVDLVGEGALGVYSGANVGTNFFGRLGGGPAWNAIAKAPGETLSLLRLGVWLEYFSFDEDRLGYGGASLVDADGRPVPPAELGSDGISPVPSAGNPGVGGYFSPARYWSGVLRLEARGRLSPKIEYGATGFLGKQSFTGAEARQAGGVAARLTIRLTERLSIPLAYAWDDFGPFAQQSLLARLVILF